jgi:selenocysteine-specific elongation factor
MQGLSLKELSFLATMSKDDLDAIISTLASDTAIINYDPEKSIFIHADSYAIAKEQMLTILADYHKRFPLKEGLAKEELRSRMAGNLREKLFNKLLDDLIKDKSIVRQRDTIRASAHKVTLQKDQVEVRDKIEKIYLKAGLEPPYFKDLDKAIVQGGGRDVLETMVKDGTLIKVKEDLYFHKKPIEDLKLKLVDYIRRKGEITTPDLKTLTGVSRKYTIPLIEYFDKIQVTFRIGDKRILRKSR